MDQMKKSGDTSIAWYKLADLIARREREKALSVYRLLSHSFEDKAYALQLEGDILYSLDDKNALEKYKQAAFLYRKEQRWINALSICEHLLELDPHNVELVGILLDLYVRLDWHEKCNELLDRIAEKINRQQIDEDAFVRTLKKLFEGERGETLHETSGTLKKIMSSKSNIHPIIKQVLKAFL